MGTLIEREMHYRRLGAIAEAEFYFRCQMDTEGRLPYTITEIERDSWEDCPMAPALDEQSVKYTLVLPATVWLRSVDYARTDAAQGAQGGLLVHSPYCPYCHAERGDYYGK